MRVKLKDELGEMFLVPAGVYKGNEKGKGKDSMKKEWDDQSESEEGEEEESEKESLFREVEIKDVEMSGGREEGELSEDDVFQVGAFNPSNMP